MAWHWGNSSGGPQPVGKKQPNELGLYDMSGNVWEWCHDWYSENYYDECHQQGIVKNPFGQEQGYSRVVRGGSWYGPEDLLQCSSRYFFIPGDRLYLVGFRVSCGAWS